MVVGIKRAGKKILVNNRGGSNKEVCGLLDKNLKLESHLPKKKNFICFNESRLEVTKNAFYFTVKALFVLKILKLLF